MTTQDQINFQRIASAIGYLNSNFKEQPNLDEVAEKVHLSPFHFQRMFSEWAGVSPKKFLQFLSLEYAKNLLYEGTTLSETTHQTGLSSTARLHDLFVKMEGMTPAEYKQGGVNLSINYSISDSPFGQILIASTEKGICSLLFIEDEESGFESLKLKFPNATYTLKQDTLQTDALSIFTKDWSQLNQVKLHLKGTPFQMKVWQTLVKIPSGRLATYGQIASTIDKPGASRAVGTAIGDNPIAYLIPCHRVIQATGHFGQYHWGADRKAAIIGWEASRIAS